MLLFKSMTNWNLKHHHSPPKVLNVKYYSSLLCELSQEELSITHQFQTRTAIAEFPHEMVIRYFLDVGNALWSHIRQYSILWVLPRAQAINFKDACLSVLSASAVARNIYRNSSADDQTLKCDVTHRTCDVLCTNIFRQQYTTKVFP
jgi:hypothetical protein